VNFDRDSMLYAVSRAAGASERKITIPILANARIQGSGGTITVDATDLEIAWLCRAQGDAELSCTVNAKRLLDVLKSAPAGEKIEVEQTDSRLNLRFGKSKFHLATLPIEDYPETQNSAASETVEMAQSDLSEMIAHTLFAVSQDDVRHYLKGALLVAKGGTLTMVATDGHRLAMTQSPIESSAEFECIVPRKGLFELRRALSPSDEIVRIGFGEGQVSFDLGAEVLTSRVIDGRFPDWERVIPKDQSAEMRVDKEAFRQGLGRVAIVASEKNKSIRMVVSKKGCELIAGNSDREEAVDEVECEYTGPKTEIAFNLQYLMEAVDAVDSDLVVIAMKGSDSAVLITDNPPGPSRYVVSPQRI